MANSFGYAAFVHGPSLKSTAAQDTPRVSGFMRVCDIKVAPGPNVGNFVQSRRVRASRQTRIKPPVRMMAEPIWLIASGITANMAKS